MTTSIDKIPMKTNRNEITPDDSNDPLVKDILNEFEQELNNQETNNSNYIINKEETFINPLNNQNINNSNNSNNSNNYNKNNKNNNYYNEEFIRKTAIIIIIIALIFSPIIFSSFIDKLPLNIANIIEDYNFYIKLILCFIIIYMFFYYNLL